ncbi:hypothetical protein NDU88_001971 [Pleurodeles waltl]|uniref:Uncharacterized protein n=1 Tax=Pleurodeles waltl TaxID=8319 RepID=A0AAV7NE41_PLEWA|nr:hypothetical protein NDU88_001971 [Pleurodeles waltl]
MPRVTDNPTDATEHTMTSLDPEQPPAIAALKAEIRSGFHAMDAPFDAITGRLNEMAGSLIGKEGIRNDGDRYYFKRVSPSKKLVKKEWAKALLPAAGLPSFLFTDRVASEASANPLLGFKSRKRPEPEIDSGL